MDGIIGNDMAANIKSFQDTICSPKLIKNQISMKSKEAIACSAEQQVNIRTVERELRNTRPRKKQMKLSRTRRRRKMRSEGSLIGDDEISYWRDIKDQASSNRKIRKCKQEPTSHEVNLHSLFLASESLDDDEFNPTRDDNQVIPAREVKNELLTNDQELFRKEQQADRTLKSLWQKSNQGREFIVENGILYKMITDRSGSEQLRVLVVPTAYRSKVLQFGHDSILAGHQGVKKTKERIKRSFFWCKMNKDIEFYIRSCKQCQLTSRKLKQDRIPLKPIPVCSTPHEELVIDFIGPMEKTKTGKRFALVIVDSATRAIEVIPMRNKSAKNVAENLMTFFTRFGVPKVIRSDNDKSFNANTVKAMETMLGISPRFSSVYYLQSQGITERANGTIKKMISKFITEFKGQWDKILPFLVFAYNDTANETLGFSPHQLIYGRSLRGFGEVLTESWATNTENETFLKSGNLIKHYDNLRESIERTLQLAHDKAEVNQDKYKHQFDKHSTVRSLDVNDDVMVMLPTTNCKLTAKHEGPYKILKKISETNFVISRNGKPTRFHINMLRKFHDRKNTPWNMNNTDESNPETVELNTAIVQVDDNVDEGELILPYGNCTATDTAFTMDDQLSTTEKHELEKLLSKYADIFSDIPGRTHLAEFKIDLMDNVPITLKPYRIPERLKPVLDEHIQKLLDLDIIEESDSPYSFPIVIVEKKNSNDKFRMTVNFRLLNAVTIKDAFPLLDVDAILQRVNGKKYLTTIDLTKCFYQIPLRKGDEHKTAFRTHRGLYHHKVMAFGMSNCPATCQRLLNNILNGVQHFAMAHMDDICIFSATFPEHMKHLKNVLQRIKASGLKANRTKCKFAMRRLKLFGHLVEDGYLKPDTEKIRAICEYPIPRTKRHLRSFIGLASFYRKFCPNFATTIKPLTDMTRKSYPERVKWSIEADASFNSVKRALIDEPILMAPNFNQPFVLQTDASQHGIAGILCQYDANGLLHPVMYASRKLSFAESRYSSIERELLAIVWSLQHYSHIVFGQEITVQTDHQPLRYSDSLSEKNSRLTRWSLILQNFRLSVEYKRGSLNGNADALSRMDYDS